MSCVRTKRHVWLAGLDWFGSILDRALSRFKLQESLSKNWDGEEGTPSAVNRKGKAEE